MFFAKIPSHTRQNAITEGDLECILTRNCEGTEQLRNQKSGGNGMSQEMEFKNIVAQYSKVKPEEMTGDMRFREDLGDLLPWILCLSWVSLRIPLILNWMKTK